MTVSSRPPLFCFSTSRLAFRARLRDLYQIPVGVLTEYEATAIVGTGAGTSDDPTPFPIQTGDDMLEIRYLEGDMSSGRTRVFLCDKEVNLQTPTRIPGTLEVVLGSGNGCQPQEFLVEGPGSFQIAYD